MADRDDDDPIGRERLDMADLAGRPSMTAKVVDQGKPDLSLVPRSLVDAAAIGFEAGLADGKYERHDWKKGMALSRCMAALLRHAHDLNDGVMIDADSGRPQIAMIAARVAMLSEYLAKGTGIHDLNHEGE